MKVPLLKTITTPGGCYVYDTWTNDILKVDAEIHRLLEGGTGTQQAHAELAQTRKTGYFRSDHPEILCFTDAERAQARRDIPGRGPAHVILGITERCNFRCSYCAYSGAYQDQRTHSGRRMSPDVLQAALAWQFGHPEAEEASIGFYGGEPLLELDILQETVRLARSLADKPVKFHVTTNGSQFSPEACRFLVENDFRVTVSFDGPPEVHDRYRRTADGGPTFQLMWEGLARLRAVSSEYFAKRVGFNTLFAPPVRLDAIHRFTTEHPEIFGQGRMSFSFINAYPSNLPPELRYIPGDQKYEAQRVALFNTFRDLVLAGGAPAPSMPQAMFVTDFERLHNRPLETMPRQVKSLGQCTPGLAKCFVSTTGDLFMCERVSHARSIGSVFTGVDVEAVDRFLGDYNAFLAEKCAGCWAVRLCNKCFLDFHLGDGFSSERLETVCAGVKRRWELVLGGYCAIREVKPDAFGWLERPEGERQPLPPDTGDG